MKVLLVFGTRPEAIKMCPLVLELKKNKEIETVVCLTGQHREMLRQAMDLFGVIEDYNLDIMKNNQTLTSITVAILVGLEKILILEKPDIVLVHGDTTTSYAAALAAFYQQIPVGHVEAGLRSGDIYSPYPEEMNRVMTDRISNLYFAPTDKNALNLKMEGVDSGIYVTGNTVIDSFAYTVSNDYSFNNVVLNNIDYDKKIVLVTAHRRENIGSGIINICNAIKELAFTYEDSIFIYPVHLNPLIKSTVTSILGSINNVKLIDPIDVNDMHNLLQKCFFVMTDSGGIQEEAPHFGKPVLVMRTETERPEAVEAGTVRIVGTETSCIVHEARKLFDNSYEYNLMAHAVNPYGDGHASEKIVKILLNYFNI